MSFKALINWDSGLSLILHALKALVVLVLYWIVLNNFEVDDFVVWSVTSSILLVATASDLGIGQYTVTQLINAEPSDWPAHIGQSLGALIPLGLLSGLFVLVAVGGPSVFYGITMAALLALRVMALPFVAVLHAKNQFKVRKALELAAYLVALLVVGSIALTGNHVYLALIALNGTFLLGYAMMVIAAARYVSISESLGKFSLSQSAKVFRNAIPFTVNNLTGLLTYGGFIWLASLALSPSEVAKLAILHSFILVNLYQIYDVFLKARQADLADTARLAPYRKLNILLMLIVPPAFLLAGPLVLSLLSGDRVEITALQVGIYGLFVALELGNLFAQSVVQVDLTLAQRLKTYAMLRMILLAGFLGATLAPVEPDTSLSVLLAVLAAGSLMSYFYLSRSIDFRVREKSATASFSRQPMAPSDARIDRPTAFGDQA